MTRAVGEIQ